MHRYLHPSTMPMSFLVSAIIASSIIAGTAALIVQPQKIGPYRSIRTPFVPKSNDLSTPAKGRRNGRPSRTRLRADDRDEQPAPSGDENDISWIENAMDRDPEYLGQMSEIKRGLAGFSVHPSYGFVAILVGEIGGTEKEPERRANFVQISPGDKERLSSVESLCLVQLAGGIDVGGAVLPPDLLADLTEAEIGASLEEDARRTVTLIGADAFLLKSDGETEDPSNASAPPSSPERDEKILSDAPKLEAAIKKLPNLGCVSSQDVLDAMTLHADGDGAIARDSFCALLETLRTPKKNCDCPEIGIDLVVSLDGGEEKATSVVKFRVASAFLALALVMRYNASIDISRDCVEEASGGFAVDQLGERFPAFRPIQELTEDSKIMEGFISTMFFKEKPPQNDAL